ncbi:MAG: hypothetical protein ABF682_02420 [Liquorilactobacillus sp.]|uniref:hypothetical protein n=1 Tax=Liquorilactobacillus sp. TaxID=2767923 RepID=UPI0039EACCA2
MVKRLLYSKTIQLIYSQASKCIDDKYIEWAERRQRPAKITIYSDTKLLTNVLSYHKTKKIKNGNYSKLITLDLAKSLVENLGFNNLNEVFWGDPREYFKNFFVTLLLEIQESADYIGYFWNIPLSTQEEIETFYEKYENRILNDGKKTNSLLSTFIGFTYNGYESIEQSGDIFQWQDVKVDNSYLKNVSSKTLTFENLPSSLDVFVKKAY